MSTVGRNLCRAGAIAALAVSCGTAGASMSGPAVTIRFDATDGSGRSSVWEAPDVGGFGMGPLTYSNITISDEFGTLATIGEITLDYTQSSGPGGGASTMTFDINQNINQFSTPLMGSFTITSSTMNFAAGTIAEAAAQSTITLNDGGGGGATLSGNFGDASAYQGQINGGTAFKSLFVGGVAVGAGSAPFSDGSLMPLDPIPGFLTDANSEWQFSLTPFDSVSGSSTFRIVIPTPGATSLLALGLVFGHRRRR